MPTLAPNLLNRLAIRSRHGAAAGVCDNQALDRSQTVDSKRRDVRVVEGARLESVFCALNPARLACKTHPPPLPPPPHRLTDGSLTENLNELGCGCGPIAPTTCAGG